MGSSPGWVKPRTITLLLAASHAALRNKSKDWLARNQNNVQNKILVLRAPTTFKLEGEVTSPSESSQGEVGDNREKWGETSGKC